MTAESAAHSVSVTRTGPGVFTAVLTRCRTAARKAKKFTGPDLLDLQGQVRVALGGVAVEWTFPEDDMRLELTDVETGVWTVTTYSGATLWVDLDRRMLLRMPVPRPDGSVNRLHGDGQKRTLFEIVTLRVGDVAELFREPSVEGHSAFYFSTPVRMIERARWLPVADPITGKVIVAGDWHRNLSFAQTDLDRAASLEEQRTIAARVKLESFDE